MTPAPYPTEDMAAVSVRGYLMGAIKDGWLVFFRNRKSTPSDEIIDQLCVVKTDAGRVLLRFVKKGRKPNTWDLVSVTGDPFLDMSLEWAEPVEWIRPHQITEGEKRYLSGFNSAGEIVE
jgi:hypothetical protein